LEKINHFGKNPINGGIPPIEKNNIKNQNNVVLLIILVEKLVLYIIIFHSIKNTGIIIKQYIIKYITTIFVEMFVATIIQPKCPIEEYASSARKSV
jgi:hypothetical protein